MRSFLLYPKQIFLLVCFFFGIHALLILTTILKSGRMCDRFNGLHGKRPGRPPCNHRSSTFVELHLERYALLFIISKTDFSASLLLFWYTCPIYTYNHFEKADACATASTDCMESVLANIHCYYNKSLFFSKLIGGEILIAKHTKSHPNLLI
jgi:hypothetical protein